MRTFVTGTDTGVGKTWVTAALAAAVRPHATVVAAKPVQSGVVAGVLADGDVLAHAAGHDPVVYASFAAPLSPHRAAALEGRAIDASALLAWIRALAAEVVLVEGAGGFEVPLRLSPRLSMVDLARATLEPGGGVLVVAADRLGVLNHTVLTVNAVLGAGLAVLGVVLNQGLGGSDESCASNLDDLRVLLDVPVVPFPSTQQDGLRTAGEAVWRAILPAERPWTARL